ncbi:MAG: hypothetical protein CMI60_00805 [Parvibaculum sp.]|nr:hypothetical protein [Parvibaculum sp.]
MDSVIYYIKQLFNQTVRKNDDCPDGYEHQMPDGNWMCGREHPEPYNFSQEEIDETYTEYKSSVNMSYSELKRWSETECSKKASIGRTAINRNLTLLSKKKADWTSANATEARKAIAYIARAIKQPQGKNVSKDCPYSKNYIALKNWAYDRNKK